MKRFHRTTLTVGFAAIAACTLLGCSQQPNPTTQPQAASTSHDHDGEAHADKGHDHEGEEYAIHGGWWCYEHAVPEKQCAMCDTKLAAELRKKGDWCDEHKRPDSLCFKCHPKNAEKFVALFAAKFGKKPPKPTE